MTLIQLQYLLAISKYQNFTLAAAKSFVTQPTLSMQIQKLEEELGVIIFDRKRQPIELTRIGKKIVEKAENVLDDMEKIKNFVNQEKGVILGEFKIGIIPTVMPTLLPMFLSSFVKAYPKLELKIEELTTQVLINRLHRQDIDVGILITPLKEQGLVEKPLYYEAFVAYIPPHHILHKKKKINVKDLDTRNLLLLKEGHCFRNNVLNFCKDNKLENHKPFEIESGNFDTLIDLCDTNDWITILPYMHTTRLSDEKKKNIRYFIDPQPVRELSIVYSQFEHKTYIIDELYKTISRVTNTMIKFYDYQITSPIK